MKLSLSYVFLFCTLIFLTQARREWDYEDYHRRYRDDPDEREYDDDEPYDQDVNLAERMPLPNLHHGYDNVHNSPDEEEDEEEEEDDRYNNRYDNCGGKENCNIHSSTSKHAKKKLKLCVTKGCVLAAAELLKNMNQHVDPCEDFYEYACGGFPANHQLKGFQTKLHSFAILREKVAYDLHNIMSKIEKISTLSVMKKLKLFYDSCMNTKFLDSQNDEPQKNLLKKYLNWPERSGNWPGLNWNMKSVMKTLVIQLGILPLFSMGISFETKQASRYIMLFSQDGLGMPRSYYFAKTEQKKKSIDAYKVLMKSLLFKFGLLEDQLETTVSEIFGFEKQLAGIMLTELELRNSAELRKQVTLGKLDKIIPEIDVLGLVRNFINLVSAEESLKVTESYVVAVQSLDYFKKLATIIRNTNPRIVANYFVWKTVVFLGHFGTTSMRDVYQQFQNVYLGTKVPAPRWKTCLGVASGGIFSDAIGRLYVDSKFNMKNKKITLRIVESIRRAFKSNLKTLAWMDGKTKAQAKKKVEKIIPMVAYPDWILDDDRMRKHYHKLVMHKNDYLGNYLSANKFAREKELRRFLQKYRDKRRWSTCPAVVNAFYSASENRIMFPAGILQAPFIDPEFPTALQYGGIGTVVGHELTHAFDDKGRKYDSDGNYKSWWTRYSGKNFEKKAECIRKQYSNYAEYGIHINGRLTAGENIADNGGVKMAYRAMQTLKRERPDKWIDYKLPGLQHLTDEKLFFLGFARLWCVINRKASTIQRIATDHHTPSRYRVIGVMSNSKAFSKAFNCPLGSAMNPKKKCTIW